MMKVNFFVTGIGTGVGKTIVSAILCEAFGADYWKPVQAGNLDSSDTLSVKKLISNQSSVFHPETYRFRLAASPHQAAKAEGRKISLGKIMLPKTYNHLIVEGAGGLMVPLNQNELMIDLIRKLQLPVVLVSRHYLGSINHTLLSVEAMKTRGLKIAGIVFNGDENKSSEKAIIYHAGLKIIGRVNDEKSLNRKVIAGYAQRFRKTLNFIG
jgi:dethiobiotin synthetase